MPLHLWARTAQVSETLWAVLNTILYNGKKEKKKREREKEEQIQKS